MRKAILISSLLWIGFLAGMQAQTLRYHALLRTDQDTVVDEEVNLTVELLEGSQDGTVVYSEQQTVTAVKGNVFLTIGAGDNPTDSLADVQWGNKKHFIRVSGTTASGKSLTTLLLPVTPHPYAMVTGQTAFFTAPDSSLHQAAAGDLYFNSEEGTLMLYDTAWKTVSLSGYEPVDTLWSFFMPGGSKYVKSGVTLSDDGNVYVGIDGDGTHPNIFAVDPDGHALWSYKSPAGKIYGSMALSNSNDTLFGTEKNGWVFALNAHDGSVIWADSVSTRVAYAGVALSHDGKTLYAGFYTGNNDIKAINTSDGSVKWEIDTPNGVSATPVIGQDSTIYFIDLYRRMYAVKDEGASGTVLWSVTDKMKKTANPVALDNERGVLYVGTQYRHFYAVKMTDGSTLWENTDVNGVYLNGAAIGPDGTVFITSETDSTLRALDPATGETIWARKLNGKVKAVPTLDAQGNIYLGDLAGYFYVLDKHGMDRWKPVKLSGEIWAGCAIANDGTIYVVAYDGSAGGARLYALDAGGIAIDTKRWPTRAMNNKRQGR